MGAKSVACFKAVLLIAGLSLSCSMTIAQKGTVAAIQSRPNFDASQPAAIASPESNLEEQATDTLNIDAPTAITQLQPDQVAPNLWQNASFPVENFQAYTSAFGYRVAPDGRASEEFHYGLDMAAPEGSSIRNWWTGEVLEVSDNTACGTSIVVQSGSWTAKYCHMQGNVESGNDGRYLRSGGFNIREGQSISAGEPMGRVGMTGRTTGPHLHWTLKYNGSYVNPAYVLRAMYQAQQAQVAR